MNLVKLLPHQGQLVQAPYVFTETNFFFLIAGYASGKTSGLTKAIENAIKKLLGKKDLEKHNPKILIGVGSFRMVRNNPPLRPYITLERWLLILFVFYKKILTIYL